MKEIKDQIVLIADEPMSNGYIYSQECLENLAKQFKEKPFVPVALPSNKQDTDIAAIAGMVTKMEVVDNKLKCDCIILDSTKNGLQVLQLLEDEIPYKLSISSIVSVNDNKVVCNTIKLIRVDINI